MPSDPMIEIPFPLAGLEEYRSLTNGRAFNGRTSAATTQSALNVRGIDPRSGRARGSSRPGFEKYYASQINGSESIQDIVSLVGAALGTQEFFGQVIVMISPAAAARGVGLCTTEGDQHSSDSSLTSSDILGQSCWDDDGHAYFCYREDSSSKFKISRRRTDNIGNADWTTSAFSASSSSSYLPLGLAVDGNTVYFYCQTSGTNNWEIWRFNATTGANLDSGSPWRTESSGLIGGLETHSTGAAARDNCLAVSNGNIAILEMRTGVNGKVRILNSAGTQLALSQVIASSAGANSYMVNIVGDGAGGFYWAGVENPAGSKIGRITSSGTVTTKTAHHFVGYSVTAQRLFTFNSSNNVVICDSNLATLTSAAVAGGSWICVHATPTGGAFLTRDNSPGVVRYAMIDANLNLIWSETFNDLKFQGASVNQHLPDGGDDLAFWRSSAQLVTAGGTVKKLKNGTLSTVTGGTEALKRNAKVIFSTQLDDGIYFADGQSATYYNGTTDAVAAWVATGSGVPLDSSGSRPTLICTWRRRIVTAGLKQDSSAIFMSAQGDPFDHDYAPENLLATSAFTQQLQDPINALIPWNDDRLIVGCDHMILQYSGDPQDGGGLDVISDTIGIAWGRPFCTNGSGVLYFVGSRGGVYRLVPGSIPEQISSIAINERLAEIDYSSHIIRMAWDDRQQGFYLIISPLDSSATTTHYWYDARNGAWWADQFANTAHNAVSLLVIDGPSEADRKVVFCGRDGYLRNVSLSATTDDGTNISSYVFMGPLNNMTIAELKVTMSNDSNDVTISSHGGDSAENAIVASARWSGTFAAGNNRGQFPKTYNAIQYLKLSSTNYWSLEQIMARRMLGTSGRLRKF